MLFISKRALNSGEAQAVENPTWGAPRIHGELLMLSFDVSERTISRWMKRAPRDPEPAKRWLTFLRNHREAICRDGLLHCSDDHLPGALLLFRHQSRSSARPALNVTKHPTSSWIIQQLREAFPFGSAPRFLIFDRDAKYGLEVPTAVRSLRVSPVRTSFESPWQKDYASHCTSWVRCDTSSLASRRCDSFMPWAFRGGLSPGCSYRQSFLSLQA